MYTKLFLFFATALMICISSYGQTKVQYKSLTTKLIDQGLYEDAIAVVQRALDNDSADADLLNKKAECHIELKQFVEAYHSLTDAIKIAPGEIYLYTNRTNLLLQFGETDLAMADVERAIALADKDSALHNCISHRGLVYLYKMEYAKAYEDCYKVYLFDAKNMMNLINLSTIAGYLDKHDESLKYLLEAYSVDSTSFYILNNLGYQYQKMEDYEKSIYYLQKAIELNPNDGYCYNNLGYSKFMKGDKKGAIKDIDRSIELNPNNSFAYRNRALIYLANRNKKKACEQLEMALQLGYDKIYGDDVTKLKAEHCNK